MGFSDLLKCSPAVGDVTNERETQTSVVNFLFPPCQRLVQTERGVHGRRNGDTQTETI